MLARVPSSPTSYLLDLVTLRACYLFNFLLRLITLFLCGSLCFTHPLPSSSRPGIESMTDRVTLTDYEARRLLNAIVKEFVQMTAEELEQQENESNEGNSMERPLTKRCSNLSTCVLGKLSQDLHKLQTFPRTDVGAGTPGKKRSAPESERYASYGKTFDSI
ncbi:calcitonin-1-like isoform X1 [Salvelinus alpinus]|uniref:calcitonin-1-like isoform X1 n=2 Tax=Salvelinus TaxID=8033 RepID=UPI0039FCD328